MAATLSLVSALSGRRRLEALQDFRGCLLIAVAVAMATANAAVMAANFGAVSYDPNGDQLIVTMICDGTKPNHHFSIQWGACRNGQQIDRPAHQTIGVDILDDDHNDGGDRERSVCPRRGRGRDCAPAAPDRALLGGPSTSPLAGVA